MTERHRQARGSKLPFSKLTEEKAHRILTQCVPRSKTHGVAMFASEFNVSMSAVYRVLWRETWFHVREDMPVRRRAPQPT